MICQSSKRLSASHFYSIQAGLHLITLYIYVIGFMFVSTEINTDLQFFLQVKHPIVYKT